ncbi:MAG: fasciclin domain-containing protein [Rhodospirillaceae bacterium]|nr:fasciclin domain-containing protein [Rhodospirillaceae bacterium]
MTFSKKILSILSAGVLSLTASSALAENIVETAVGAGSFNTLVAAVQAAGLVDTLTSPGPFTVFAPTDEAFGKLPSGAVEDLLKPENRDQLIAVLTYHVIPGQVMSADIDGKELTVNTVQGQPLNVDATDGVNVNNARVVHADIITDNGVIHAIDSVLLPE